MAYWFFPSNKKKFDLVRCLNANSEVEQPNYYNKILAGDTVFVYVTEPYGQIMYQMEAVEIIPLSQINLARWTRHAPFRCEPPKGNWVRMRVVKKASGGYKPLQYQSLEDNDIKVAGLIYPLSRAKAEYLMDAFNRCDTNG